MNPVSIILEHPIGKYSGNSGIYVQCDIDPVGKMLLKGLASSLGLSVDSADLHVTVMWSKRSIPLQDLRFDNPKFSATCNEIRHWVGHNDKVYIVAVMHSEDLVLRHAHYVSLGAEPTFAPYVPHTTLAKLELGQKVSPALQRLINTANKRLAGEPIDLTLTLCWPEDVKTD